MRRIDALVIPYYYPVDRWHNDGADSRAVETVLGHSRGARTYRDAVVIEDKPYDFSRFLSWVRYGTTREYERYDSYSLTLLVGSYYLSFLRRRGFDVAVANATSRATLEELAGKYDPRFVLLSTTLMLEHTIVQEAIAEIRRRWPEAVIVVGGLFLVEMQKTIPRDKFGELLLAYGADAYVVSPRGEFALLEILRRGSAEALADPPIDSTFVVTGDRLTEPASMKDLEVPMDDNYIRWNSDVPHEHLYHTVHTRTARSCAFVCAFCNFPVNQGPLTLMSLEAFEKELTELEACGRVRSLIFTDDTFNVPQKRFKDLCRVLAKFDFEWYSFFRAQFADAETVELMKAAGCKGVFLGIESVDDEVLKYMNKAATVKSIRRGVAELAKHDIRTHANFIVGFPGDTEEKSRKCVSFLDEMGIDFFLFSPWYFVPSTPIAARKLEFRLKGAFENWTHRTMDSTQAFALAEELSREPRFAVPTPELAANEFWSEILLYSNGFTLDEAKVAFRTFNKLRGKSSTMDDIRTSPDYAPLRQILERREMPRPSNS